MGVEDNSAAEVTRRLANLTVKDGFRLRGMEMTRIETFTDAAFAFALTMLVLSSFPPDSIDKLKSMMHDIPVMLFGAANLMVFWSGHNEWSRRYGMDDQGTLVLSASLVCAILVYVYPLRFVGNLLAQFISRLTGLSIGHAPQGVFVMQDVNTAFIIYAAGFVACGFMIILLNWHAWRHRDTLKLNEIERHMTLSEIGAWSILCGVGIISAIVGLAFPDKPGLPGAAYMLLSVLMPAYGIAMNRRHGRVRNETPSHSEVLKALGADVERDESR